MKIVEGLEFFNNMSSPLDKTNRQANNLSGKKNSRLFSIPMQLSNHQVMNNHPKIHRKSIRKTKLLLKKLHPSLLKNSLKKSKDYYKIRKLM